MPLTSGSATTHIIKPVNLNFPDLPRNEAFCMELARKTGLDVPDSELIKMGKHELFIVSRYDRQESDHKVIRIHQEDFCQALGFPVSRKYQEGGGPGFAQCRELIDEYLSDQGADARINLARIMVLNYLIGNHDAHGKNFSIIHGKELRIAPFYDLVSTQVYPALDNKFAMAIGQTYKADRIKEHSFRLFVTDMNIRPQKLTELMNEICQLVNKRYPVRLADHEKRYGPSKIYTDLFNVLQTNLKSLDCLFD